MTTANTTTASSRELSADAQRLLDEIAGVLGEGGSVADITAEVAARLAALAQTFGIDQVGDQTLEPGQRSLVRFEPLVDLPPISTARGTFTIVPTAGWQVLYVRGTVLRNREDFHAPDLSDLELDVLLAPRVVELTRQQPSARAFGIQVKLTLAITLPATFFTPAAAGPRTITGSAIVPKPVLNGALDKLSQAATAVIGVLPNLPLAGLLREFIALAAQVGTQPHARVKVASKVGDNHEIRRLDKVGIPNDGNALDAGNAISSLALLSPRADVVVECWNGAEFDSRAARFDILAGSQRFVLIENLAIERTQPVTIPERRLTVIKPPGAFNSFNDGISAIRIRRTRR